MSQEKLLDRACGAVRRKEFSYRTEQAYVSWIKRYIFYHPPQHPGELDERAIESFLTHRARLANHVAPTPCATALPPTCWRTAATSALSRNCWAMPMSRPP